VATGLSDLPWHRDCGLGGHPVTCPTLNVGIQLDAATATGASNPRRAHRGPTAASPARRRSRSTRAGRRDRARGRRAACRPPPGTGPAAPPPRGCRRAVRAIPAGKSYNDVILRRVGG
jgi:hypothetical protein